MRHPVIAFVEDLKKALSLQPHQLAPDLVRKLISDAKGLYHLSEFYGGERFPLGDRPLEGLKKFYFTPGVPEETTALLMDAMGCEINHDHLQYTATLHNVANPSVFFSKLVMQHHRINDFSLYRFMDKLVNQDDPQPFLLLAPKYLAFPPDKHPEGMAEKFCRWAYKLSLACGEKTRLSLDEFFIAYHEQLLAGLTFQHLPNDPLALGMAQHFKSLGLDALCERYALAQRSWPQVIEHFVILDEMGFGLEPSVMAHLRATSTGSKNFARASLYHHLARPGSDWVGFDIPERDQAPMVVHLAEKLWMSSPHLHKHIAQSVNDMAGADPVLANALVKARLDPQIAKQCDALLAVQLEHDLGL